MYQYILFDLDGTLTDPKQGITKCIQYALKEECGIEETNPDKLEYFIGPPLRDSFRESYGIAEEDMDRVIAKFQERYRPTGVHENQIYPGMHALLHRLKEKGCLLAIASSKPQEFVHVVLQKFDIEDCFSVIVGSVQDNVNDTKTEVMEKALAGLKKLAGRRYDPAKVLMVGDRKFDVEGAHHFGVDSAAVTYGYAPEGELATALPTYMADSVEELGCIITGEKPYEQYRDKPSLLKTWEILYPLLAYWACQLVVFNVLYNIVSDRILLSGSSLQKVSVYLNAAAFIAVWPMLALLYQKSASPDTSFVITRRKQRKLRRESLMVASYSASLALGLNILIAYYRLAGLSEKYQQVAANQYSVALPVGLVVFGILSPFTEEIIFRGILYNRMKKYFPQTLAMVLSALVFGCYHGNPVQMMYAFVMGLAMALMYEVYGMLGAPVLFHCTANLLVYLISKEKLLGKDALPVYYGVALLALAIGITCWYGKEFCRKENRKKNHTTAH